MSTVTQNSNINWRPSRTSYPIAPLPVWQRALTRLLNQRQINLDKVAKTVIMDPFLVAQTLGHCEFAALPAEEPQLAIRNAIEKHGMPWINELYISRKEYYLTIKTSCPRFHLGQFWQNAILTGNYALWLYKNNAASPNAAYAYFAGLLHNIGLMALVYLYPIEMNRLLSTATSLQQMVEAETRELGIDHITLSADTLQLWHLPSEIVSAIRHAASPQDAGNDLAIALHHAIACRGNGNASDYQSHYSLAGEMNAQYRHLLAEQIRIQNLSDLFVYE